MTQPAMTDSAERTENASERFIVKSNEYEALDSLNLTGIAFSKM